MFCMIGIHSNRGEGKGHVLILKALRIAGRPVVRICGSIVVHS